MRIRALQTFTIALPEQMIVLNAAKGKEAAGEADIPEEIAQQYIDAGIAEKVKGKPKKDPLDHDGNGKKGGAAPAVEPAPAEADEQEGADHDETSADHADGEETSDASPPEETAP